MANTEHVKILNMEKREIKGKPVYIFESHNVALRAWDEIKTNHQSELILITLDHHTDDRPAFKGYARSLIDETYRTDDFASKVAALMKQRLAEFDRRDGDTIQKAVADLRNDEQIDAAIRLGIFSFAFSINQMRSTHSKEEETYFDDHEFNIFAERPKPPFTYSVPPNHIFTIREDCEIGCEKDTHDDDCCRKHSDQSIESVMLDQLVSKANGMAASAKIEDIKSIPYVLDIDLDYFRTIKSLTPDDPSAFHDLIKRAVAITIATEPNYVHDLRLDRELTSEYALQQIIGHIDHAMG